MAGYTTLLFIFFVIQTICQGKELSMYNMPSPSPPNPPPSLPRSFPHLHPFSFSSAVIKFLLLFIHYSAVLDRLFILNRKKYIKCNIWFGDLWNLTGLKYSKALFLTSWRISKSSSKTILNTNFLCNHDEICPNPALSCRRDIKCALIGIFFSFWI